MKRIKANYHTLHVLRSDQTKLRKAIISFCYRDLVNCISECVLNVLNAEIALTVYDTRKLRKHKLALNKILDKQTTLSSKKRLIVHRGFLLRYWLPTLASLITAK
jgi:hypothetical protein